MSDESVKVKPIKIIQMPVKFMKMWESFRVCEKACKEMVKEVVGEYEECLKQKKAWWDVVKEEYGYDDRGHVLEIDHEDRLKVWDRTTYEFKKAFEHYDDNLELKKLIRKNLVDDTGV